MMSFKQARIESLLMTIDQLSMAKIRHLQQIHELKSYSNACRVIKQLSPYVHETMHNKEKVLYLNKEGRQLIGSTREVKHNMLMEHTLLRNEAYLYFNCPMNWKSEYKIESKERVPTLGIQFKGLSPSTKKVICDAAFTRNGYMHLVEIDNTRKMIDNQKKIETYADVLAKVKDQLELIPTLYVFTTSLDRKRKFERLMQQYNLRGEVKLFSEILDRP